MKLGEGVARRLRKFLLLVPCCAALAITLADAPRPAAALDGEEAAVLDLINQARAASGLGRCPSTGLLATPPAGWR
jgi:hypothetical protein